MNKDKREVLLNTLIGMNTDDLKEAYTIVLDLYKSSMEEKNKIAKYSFAVGDRVHWDGRKGLMSGIIEKINRTKAIIVVDEFVRWNVPMGILKKG